MSRGVVPLVDEAPSRMAKRDDFAWLSVVYTLLGPKLHKIWVPWYHTDKCLTSSNKKLLGTSASLLVTTALLLVTRS